MMQLASFARVNDCLGGLAFGRVPVWACLLAADGARRRSHMESSSRELGAGF